MTPWVEKHRPTCFVDVRGQDKAIEEIKNFIYNFGNSKKKALLLYGPPGTGKTTIAHVSAKETHSEIFELNASDFRNKAKLQEVLKPALEQRSLLNNNKIILVDEADGISGTDRGGIPELIRLIKISPHPIVITANEVWDKKFSDLRKVCQMVQLKELDYKIIRDVLICILRKEGKFVEGEVLTNLSIKSGGDLRAAINDLQTISKLPPFEQGKIVFDERNKETDIFNALKRVFKMKPSNETLSIYDSVKMPLDEIILWVEENIPKEYRGKELYKAFDRLSKVDVFKGRIYKQQYWRFMVYENILLSYGISASKKENKMGFTNYQKPTRILKIWMNNQRTTKKKSIAEKYAEYSHISKKRAMYEFPIIKQVITSDPKIAIELKLTEEEIEYLKN